MFTIWLETHQPFTFFTLSLSCKDINLSPYVKSGSCSFRFQSCSLRINLFFIAIADRSALLVLEQDGNTHYIVDTALVGACQILVSASSPDISTACYSAVGCCRCLFYVSL